jgi:glycosyltransferase involved in cell wall biosynthesis
MKILVLCTYPIQNPAHGGQFRVRNMVDTYRRAGHEVQVVGVLGSDQYPPEDGFVEFPGQQVLSSVYSDPSLMEDYAISKLFADSQGWFERLAAKIKITPDVIEIVQPWLFGFCKRYMAQAGIRPAIVYSSQNIEFYLKEQIVRSYCGENFALIAADSIRSAELEVISGADAIVCVSQSDVEWTRQVSDKPILLAPNGVKPWKTSADGMEAAKAIVGERRFALYCASGHPPNVTGFFEILGGGFGSLTPDQSLVIAGGAGYAIAGDARVHQSAKLAERILVAGIISQPCLEGLLEMAHCIVLPLTQGGGTNLKTAEALWSGKYVIGTTVAMRGFEDFIGQNGVFVANDSSDFKRTLRQVMSLEPLQLSTTDREKRKRVLWDECLIALPSFAEKIEKLRGS